MPIADTLSEPGRAPKPKRLALEYMTLDARLQSRELKPAAIKEYAAAMRRGEEFPPVVVVRDRKDQYYLVDGHHRFAATQTLTGIDSIAVKIVEGSFADALWLSWGANRGHGLPRTREAKRRAIRAVLQHRQWGRKSDREIARHIGCDHKTVAAMRRRLKGGEFPTERSLPESSKLQPSKRSILRACLLLGQVKPEHLHEFDEAELVNVRAAYTSMRRLVHGAETGKPITEEQTAETAAQEE